MLRENKNYSRSYTDDYASGVDAIIRVFFFLAPDDVLDEALAILSIRLFFPCPRLSPVLSHGSELFAESAQRFQSLALALDAVALA